MDQRVAKLEALAEKTGEQLTAINKDLAVVRSNHATREDIATLRGDVHRLINEQTWKIIGATVTFGTLLVWCLKSNHQIMVLAARATDAKMVSALLCHTNGLGSSL